MDQLEALKKQWQATEQQFPKLSYQDIYAMILKKSSSIVKWIVIISVCEIALWTILSFFVPESSREFNNDMGLKAVFLGINIFTYAVTAVFIYLFYQNYKKIQTTATVKELMGNILRTRKTVHYFVYYNIGMAALLLIGTNLYYYYNQDKLADLLRQDDTFGGLPAETFINVNIVAGILLIGFLVLFYYVIYGLLLRRLKRNYKELEKMEV